MGRRLGHGVAEAMNFELKISNFYYAPTLVWNLILLSVLYSLTARLKRVVVG